MRSHKKALIKAVESNSELVLICEDDALFCEDFKRKLSECIEELPVEWDALSLNGTDHSNEKSTPYSQLLKKCKHTTGAFGILFNKNVLGYLIDQLEKEEKLVDIYYAESMKKLNWFRSIDKLVLHPKGFSEIKGKFVDYKKLY